MTFLKPFLKSGLQTNDFVSTSYCRTQPTSGYFGQAGEIFQEVVNYCNKKINSPTISTKKRNELTSERTHERTNKRMNERTNKLPNEGANARTNEPTNERADKRMKERMKERMNELTSE